MSGLSSLLSNGTPASTAYAENYDFAVIYRVGSRHEFDNCIVDANNFETVPILKCDKPHAPQLVKFTINFVKFSPVPNALEFEEDREYFFLSTSSGSRQGLHYASGGLCAKFNMRFSITIQSNRPAAAVQTGQASSAKRPQANSLLSKLSRSDDLDLFDEVHGDDDDEGDHVNVGDNELDEDRHQHRQASKTAIDAPAKSHHSEELRTSNMNLVVSAAFSSFTLFSPCFLLLLAFVDLFFYISFT